MRKLNDTQLVILVNAAQRGDGAIHPLPKSISLNKAAQTRVLKALLKRGLVSERPATGATNGWRQAEDGQRLDLAITEAGFEAVGIDPSATDERESAKPLASRKRGTVAKKETPGINKSTPILRPGTKLALLVDMVSRPDGATIAEISEATGWQAHSVRGAISGTLRKRLGLAVTSAGEDRGRVYRIDAGQ